jgi:hypothetical protein
MLLANFLFALTMIWWLSFKNGTKIITFVLQEFKPQLFTWTNWQCVHKHK